MIKRHERHRLHIDALLLDPFYGVQGKFLTIFGMNHEWTPIDTKVKKEEATTDDTDPSLPITEILNQEDRNRGKGFPD